MLPTDARTGRNTERTVCGIMEFWVIVYAYSYGVSIKSARWLTEAERAGKNPEMADRIMVGMGKTIDLPALSWQDLPRGAGDGEFLGCGNRAYIITADAVEGYIKLNAELTRAAKAADLEEEIMAVKARLAAAERQGNLPSAAEAKKAMDRYNAANNEGGYGYIPHIYSQEEVARLRHRLDRLQAEWAETGLPVNA